MGVAVAATPPAVADEVVGLLRARTHAALTTPRDPTEFAEELSVIMPKPIVVLNRQDAVAAEMLQYARTMSERDALRVSQALCEEADRLGMDAFLFLAVIHVESFYDHLAISPTGAEGLMQLMPHTAEWTAERMDLSWPDSHSFDPVLNVRLGARYLDHLQTEFRSLEHALTAYNRGPKATRFLINEHGSLPREIADFYATKVLDKYRKLKWQYGDLPRA